MDFVECDIETIAPARRVPMADTVIMNPPFGTRRAGIDVCFLLRAVQLASSAVYSLHKSSTREHLVGRIQSWGCEVEVIAQLKFDIPAMYKFHKHKSLDVEVDLIRINTAGPNVERIWEMPECVADVTAEEALEAVAKGSSGRRNESKGSGSSKGKGKGSGGKGSKSKKSNSSKRR